MSALQSDIIGKIYEAAVFPDKWRSVIADIGRHCALWGGAITWETANNRTWIATPNFQELLEEFVAEGWAANNTRLEKANREGQFSFAHDAEFFTPQERDKMPIYRDFLYPRGFGYGVGTLIGGPGSVSVSVCFEAEFVHGPIRPEAMSFLDGLRPHIARSLVLTADLELQKADLMVIGLNAIGSPAAVVQSNGLVLSSNRLFENLKGRVSIHARDRIFLNEAHANRLLYEALANIRDSQIKSIPLPAIDDVQACIVHVIPLCNDALDFASKGVAIILVAAPSGTTDCDLHILKGLYDLSKGEARVATEMQTGSSLPEIATRLGLSYETIRTVAKQIYAKTGSTGQSDLVRRLSVLTRYNLSIPRD